MKYSFRCLLLLIALLCGLLMFSFVIYANDGTTDALDEYQNDNKPEDRAVSFPDKVMMIDKTMGGRREYETARLNLNGRSIDSDVPAILYKIGNETRTLVPIRVISESLGGEVKWENDEKIVKIFFRGMIVQLRIDDAEALINGVETTLPSSVPPKLMSYIDIQRTYVPVRFISEAFGAKVDWDNDNRTVMITNKVLGEAPDKQPSQALVSLEYRGDESPKKIRLHFSEELTENIVDYTMSKDSVHRNERLVIDIDNTMMALTEQPEYNESENQYKLAVNDTNISSVRSGQLKIEPYVTRVVLDMNRLVEYTLKKEDKLLIVELSENEVKPMQRGNNDRKPKSRLGEIMSYEVIKPMEFSILSLSQSAFGNFSVANQQEGMVSLEFPLSFIADEDYEKWIDDEFISRIYSEKSEDKFLLHIETGAGVRAYLNPNNYGESNQEIVFARDVAHTNPDGIIIGIDPGHGGSDPGAIGRMNGTATSEVDVLNVFIPMLKAKLEQRGYRVQLTREDDIDVSLDARTKYAELINARIFASVHANAASSPFATGIEVFANFGVDASKRLAECIGEDMTALSGVVYRGVKDYNLHITRESLMPAILVELGFLTSPSDLIKLRDSKHLEVLAEGMARGIERYLNGN